MTTQAKHTPGPWALDINTDCQNWEYNIREKNPSSHQTIGKHIASVNNHLCPLANANLIAAAPELLEALQFIVGNFNLSIKDVRCGASVRHANEQAWKAIANAVAKH